METLEKRIVDIEIALKMMGLAAKEVLSFDEASRFLGLSKSHLYKLTSGRKVPHYKPFGKLCFFNRCELEQWLQQNRIRTDDEMESQAAMYCLKSQKTVRK